MTQTGGSDGPEPTAGGAPDSSVAVSTGPESEQADAPEAADLAATASPDLIANSLGEYARIWWRRVRGGESGALPVVIGLIVIVVYFQVRNSLFLSAGNLVNLITQAAFIVTFGMAEVFVLLLGEIDLSVGYNAALGAVITLWMLSSNLPLWLAVVAGLAFSAAFAGLEGVIITRLRLPSFVVTLAGYLGGFGLLLALIDMAAAGVIVVLICNQNRGVGLFVVEGVPWVVLVVLILLVVWTTLLNRTRLGRYIYAIGGNAEAARRAGINLSRIRVTAFALCGLTAGITGIIYSSNLGSISSNFNGGQYVLYAVAAAVIGGVSLFGGRGRMLGAVLGGIIVAVIYNGLQLLGLGAAPQAMWTAAVLLAAVTVDTTARRGRTST